MNTLIKNQIDYDISYQHFYCGLNQNDLPWNERKELEENSSELKLRKKTTLYFEGETPKGLYILVKGKVKIYHLNQDGSEQIYFIYSAGDMFGYRQILSNSLHTDSVTCLEDCEFLFVNKEKFQHITKKSTALSNLFLKSICKEFTILTHLINIFTKKSIKERTAYFLLILNEKYRKPGQFPLEAEIRVSRIDLASCIGASLENLVRTIRDFKDKNYIRLDGKSIIINDFESLHNVMGFPILNTHQKN